MKTLLVIFLLMCLVPIVAASDGKDRRLSDQEMVELVGKGCYEAYGVSLGLAFASGVSVGVPVLSAGFMTASLIIGLGAVIMC